MTATFELLKAFLDPINSKKLPSNKDVADQLRISIAAINPQIHRRRKQYKYLVRKEINRTALDFKDLDAKIHELCEALRVAEGWIIP